MNTREHWKHWKPGDPVLINRIVWDDTESAQIEDVLDNDWFGPGHKVAQFGKAFSKFVGSKFCQPVNSGSSALTLAVDALIELGKWGPGDLILHPLLTFPTSIAPAIRAGLIPLFVDVDPCTYQIDLNQAEQAIKKYGDRVKGAIVPHLLGNICDMDRLLNILAGRPLIEDCCDTLGGYYGDRHVGNYGQVSAFSFYGSHHITTGGVGGALVTDDQQVYDLAKSMTHWGRNDYGKIEDQYERFEKRYWYETLGHDYQMTELQAAFGIAQLGRVEEANKLRRRRFQELESYFSDLNDYFHLPHTDSDYANPSWFCFPVTLKVPDEKNSPPFNRAEFATHLIRHRIEIRPLFTGNIMKHPAFAKREAIVFGSTSQADLIGRNGLFLPAWGMSDGEMAYQFDVLDKFFNGTHRYRRTFWRYRNFSPDLVKMHNAPDGSGHHPAWGIGTCPICGENYNGPGYGENLKLKSPGAYGCRACKDPICLEEVKSRNRRAISDEVKNDEMQNEG